MPTYFLNTTLGMVQKFRRSQGWLRRRLIRVAVDGGGVCARMVGATGLEPARLSPMDPKSIVSANSTTRPSRKRQHCSIVFWVCKLLGLEHPQSLWPAGSAGILGGEVGSADFARGTRMGRGFLLAHHLRKSPASADNSPSRRLAASVLVHSAVPMPVPPTRYCGCALPPQPTTLARCLGAVGIRSKA